MTALYGVDLNQNESDRIEPHSKAHTSYRSYNGANVLPKPRSLAWPDKAGLVIAFVVACLSVFVCAITLFVGDTVTYGSLNHALAAWSVVAILTIAAPCWILMRALDLVTGGPWHRRLMGSVTPNVGKH